MVRVMSGFLSCQGRSTPAGDLIQWHHPSVFHFIHQAVSCIGVLFPLFWSLRVGVRKSEGKFTIVRNQTSNRIFPVQNARQRDPGDLWYCGWCRRCIRPGKAQIRSPPEILLRVHEQLEARKEMDHKIVECRAGLCLLWTENNCSAYWSVYAHFSFAWVSRKTNRLFELHWLDWSFSVKSLFSWISQAKLDDDFTSVVYDKMYENFVEEIDAKDNGISECDEKPRSDSSGHF